LVALGCQDPVTKIAKLKTSDPVRLDTVEIFRTWWLLHGNKAVTAKDLSNDVKALLVPKAKEPSRQAVASRVAKLDGTRLAGFHLTSNKDDENKGYWTPVHYRLEASKSAQTADATSVDVITEADIREYMSKPAARPADAGGMPFVIKEATKEQLRVQGRSHEEIANLTPQKAREILLAALATVLAEWGKTIGVGATRSLDHVIKIAADHPSLKAALVVVAPMDGAETISNVRLARCATITRFRSTASNCPAGAWMKPAPRCGRSKVCHPSHCMAKTSHSGMKRLRRSQSRSLKRQGDHPKKTMPTVGSSTVSPTQCAPSPPHLRRRPMPSTPKAASPFGATPSPR
jgi:hypothetical protein